MFQRGFVPIMLVLAIVLLAGGSFYLLNNLNPSQVEDSTNRGQNNYSEETISTSKPSPRSSPKNKGIPVNVTTTLNTARPSGSNVVNTNGTAPPAAPEVMINAVGSYTYSGQEIKYAISFPKNGGGVTGNISGVCNGPITGSFTGGDGGTVNSKVDAICQIGPLKQDLKADFEGKVYFSQGRADLEWKGSIPFYSGSKEFSLTFTPL